MSKTMVMMVSGAAVLLALGVAIAQTTNTEKSGNSTTTITQEPGTNMKRTVTKTPDGQTIVQQSGGGKAKISQSTSSASDDEDCKDKTAAKKDGKTAAADDDDDCD